MKNALRFVFSTLAGTVLVVGALALPPTNTRQTLQDQPSAAKTQSASGKIASVEPNSFTLTLAPGSTVSQDPRPLPSAPSTMTFAIDKNTTVEGKLNVGSSADVTYRQDNGANIAISVHVAQ
jgi:hypothetical protein